MPKESPTRAYKATAMVGMKKRRAWRTVMMGIIIRSEEDGELNLEGTVVIVAPL